MTKDHITLEIAVARPVFKTYTYSVPHPMLTLAQVGKRVLVPFGSQKITGYILKIEKQAENNKLKMILDVLDDMPLFTPAMLPFFRWIAQYYFHPIGEVIKTALPGGLTLYESTKAAITPIGEKALSQGLATPLENDILTLLKKESLGLSMLRKRLDKTISTALIHTLEEKKWLLITRKLRGQTARPKMERYVSPANCDFEKLKLSEPRKKIINILQKELELSVKQLKEKIHSAPSLIKSMQKDEQVIIFSKQVYRDPLGVPIQAAKPPHLTNEQQKVIGAITPSLAQGFCAFLLAGVTASGKTEIYLKLAEATIAKKRFVLVLVPEIALISQTARRFRARFGECIAVLHSGLSTGERFDQWLLMQQNQIKIVIGARSAIFAPLSNIGLIVVDEEHDTSYKQEGGLHYNARDIALVRAKQENATVVLGSATPSVQSYFNVQKGKLKLVTLSKRINQRQLPEITLVDLRRSRERGGPGRFISPVLHDAITQTLARGEQTLLFLNRRGFAGFPVCGVCGETLRCKYCDISLTFHRQINGYKCHYCGFSCATNTSCQTCGSSKIKLLGMGTEKVESAVSKLFPTARVARLDKDTTTQKGTLVKILKKIKNQKIDIIVGTQMIAKGHDFSNITLVGIICADLSLSMPDFRAGERTFQVLAQVAGRSGRGDSPGQVILQTYAPQHFSIQAAKAQDFKLFYKQEIGFRQKLNYPPFTRMVQLKISGPDRKKTAGQAIQLGELCTYLQTSRSEFKNDIIIMGPLEAPITKIANQYRWQILLKSKQIATLHLFIHRILYGKSSITPNRQVNIKVDVDPYQLM